MFDLLLAFMFLAVAVAAISHTCQTGKFVDKYGIKRYFRNKVLHREDGPALIYPHASKLWIAKGCSAMVNGKMVKKDDELVNLSNHPTLLYVYYYEGLKHRDNGPAEVWSDGREIYYFHGLLHRKDGPAIDWDGSKLYFQYGKLHREKGPAVETVSGEKNYYLNGKLLRQHEWKDLLDKRISK